MPDHGFDEIVDRRGTSSIKWDKYEGRNILPLWVADMDFMAPPAIVEALAHRIEHGIFGYTHPPEELTRTVVSMLEAEYGWQVESETILWLPGLVTGLNLACRAICDQGESVVTAVPIYPPFLSAPVHSGLSVSKAALLQQNGRWEYDFEALERAILPQSRLFLLCNPHNPVGRVLDEDELSKIAQLCEKHDLFICSDEIHCGLLLDGEKRHVPIASLSKKIEKRTITLMAPSKTFNIPGLSVSFAIIPDPSLRQRFSGAMAGIAPHVNALGYTAALAAYRDCSKWHLDLIDYLARNRDLVEQSIPQMGLAMAHVEATYLAWIDARHIENPALFFENSGVGLSDGADFGCHGFVRLNFGCPRSRLAEALQRMKSALR